MVLLIEECLLSRPLFAASQASKDRERLGTEDYRFLGSFGLEAEAEQEMEKEFESGSESESDLELVEESRDNVERVLEAASKVVEELGVELG